MGDYNRLPIVPGDLEPAPSARFTRQLADPFAAGYVTVDDTLCFRVLTQAGTQVVNLSLRYQGVNGEIRPEFYSITVTTTAGVPFVKLIPGAEGWLVSATVEAPNSLRGQTWVSLEIQRGTGAQDVTFGQQMIAGYPGLNQRIGYPQSVPGSPLDGRGNMRSIAIGAPAAGAEFSALVPAGAHWLLRSLSFQLVTAVAVATRQVTVQVLDAGINVVLRSPAALTQAASLTVFYSFFNGPLANNGTTVVNGGFPEEFRLVTGWRITSLTPNIQAADQYSLIILGVEEFLAA